MNNDKRTVKWILCLRTKSKGLQKLTFILSLFKTVFDYLNVAHLLNIFKMVRVCDCVATSLASIKHFLQFHALPLKDAIILKLY